VTRPMTRKRSDFKARRKNCATSVEGTASRID
jgi:hypothetical protein